ncbi:MAG: hypothetical protein ACYTGP_01395 [Planctomycetota bacterium]|jgi:hypothetical protein
MTVPTSEATPKRRRAGGLIALNAGLLLVLGAVTFAPSADAQNRVRGSYLMTAGGANGAISSVLYVVDTTNQEMIAVTYEPSQKNIIGIGYRDLVADRNSLLRGAEPR